MKILIADDSEVNRRVLAAMLQKDGPQVLQAEDGQQAVTIFAQEHPDLVIMDVMMPVMNGYQAAERIKADAGDQFVPIIFLTAVTDEAGLAGCITHGGDDFLTKPLNYAILKAKINAMIRIRELYATVYAQNQQLNAYKARVDQEQDVARNIINKVLQTANLDQPNILCYRAGAEILSGDVLLATVTPHRTQRLMVGDFTGHGLGAAVGAMLVADSFYDMTAKGLPIGKILEVMNRNLRRTLPIGMFCCACLVEYDPATKSLTVWNGGMPDVLVYRPGHGLSQRVSSRRMPLGVMNEETMDTSVDVLQVADGDRVYLYSDGVPEAANPNGEMFGQEGLAACIQQNQDPDRLFAEVLEQLHAFLGGLTPQDDIALFELTCVPADIMDETDSSPGLADPAPHPVWRLQLEFDADELRRSDPVSLMISMLEGIQCLQEQKESVFLILAELITNAVDHGLLRLDSSLKRGPAGAAAYAEQRAARLKTLKRGKLTVDLTCVNDAGGSRLTIRVCDNGPGFDCLAPLPDMNGNVECSGRGISLVRALCKELTYSERGNVAEAVYEWSAPAPAVGQPLSPDLEDAEAA
jgi:serine phosphatase RsbU (regulator of sigma subunit)/anti-sigma regulatory factor (Ser/Thr protein kinase)